MTEPRTSEPWVYILKEKTPFVRKSGPGAWISECPSGAGIAGAEIDIAQDWQASVPGLVNAWALDIRSRWKETVRLEAIENEILLIKTNLARFQRFSTSVVLIDTMAPEPIDIIKPFHINVEAHEDEFRASFVDANLCTFGDTRSEAIWNLKDIITATFQCLCGLGEHKLGPGPARQLKILSTFIRNQT